MWGGDVPSREDAGKLNRPLMNIEFHSISCRATNNLYTIQTLKADPRQRVLGWFASARVGGWGWEGLLLQLIVPGVRRG